MHSIIIASLLAFATGSLANNFIYPAATGGQAFHDGDTIDVAWTTTYTDPVLQLYCNYLTTPLVNISIPASDNVYSLKLDVGKSPNCYLQLSQGPQNPNPNSFGTGIFSIQASNGSMSTWGSQGYMASNSSSSNCNCQCTA